jgi:RND superfamily putative drug exporter
MRGGENGGALRSGELGFGEKPSHFLYGRDTELGVVVDLVEGVRNRGGVLLVRSEPGIGKSTLLAAAARTSGVVRVTAPKVILGQAGKPGVATADVYPAGSPQDASTTNLLHDLRNQVVPSSSSSGLQVLIGGQTAIFDDFSTVLSNKLPLFIGVVVLLSFLLLTAVFRSLLIPFMAALMNLLTAGASFGLITAVFQWGWAASLLGIDKTGPIEAFIPVMMFAIVFGLSMDYQVFLVTRIYEEWHRRGDNRAAVTHGLAPPAGPSPRPARSWCSFLERSSSAANE